MPVARRPHAVVWTDARVGQWREHGRRPTAAVWTTAQLAEFLGFGADDPLYPLWWLVALRGLRRGEVAGLRWQDIDLARYGRGQVEKPQVRWWTGCGRTRTAFQQFRALS
jgi:integrase